MRIECSDGYYDGDVNCWNEPHGEGTYHWRNGEKYSGQFVRGKRTGEGTFYRNNGDEYSGTFNDGRKVGKGVYTWKNGDRFEGRWENSVRTGKGVWYYASDGAVVYGEYVNGEWISEK